MFAVFVVVMLIALIAFICWVIVFCIQSVQNYHKTYYFFLNGVKISFVAGSQYKAGQLFIGDKLVDSQPISYSVGKTLTYQSPNLSIRINVGNYWFTPKPKFSVFINNQEQHITNFQGEELYLPDVEFGDFEVGEKKVERKTEQKTETETKYCQYCGAKIKQSALYCEKCGSKQDD